MSGGSVEAWGSERAVGVRGWWDDRTFVGDVAAVFTLVTVVNGGMMLTGWDEPKAGTFAYVHLLGRLGIITVVVGLFYLGELRDRIGQRQRSDGSRSRVVDRSPRPVVASALQSLTRAPVDCMARAFTAVVTVVCLLTIGLAEVRAPSGGPGLYRDLLIMAAVMLSAAVATSAWQRRRATARTTSRG